MKSHPHTRIAVNPSGHRMLATTTRQTMTTSMKTNSAISQAVWLKSFLIVAAVLGLVQIAGAQGTTTWAGAGVDQAWSTAANWTTSGGSTPPGTGDTVVFPNATFTLSPDGYDNIVSNSITIAALQYLNASPNVHTTHIVAGQTLTVNGTFTEGVATLTTVDTMSGTGNFTVNSIAGNFNVGGAGASTETVTLTLADGTNTLDVKTLSLGESASNNGRTCTLNLGAGPTFFNADNVNLGTGKGSGTVQWLGATTNGITIRDHTGTGRAILLLGNGTSGSGSSVGKLLAAGHPADILASTATLGGNSGTDTGTGNAGTLTYDTGTFDVTTLLMGKSTAAKAAAAGTLNVGGSTNTATLIVNSPSGPGGGSFILGDSTTASTGAGTFNLNQNGTAQIYTSMVKFNANSNTAAINITGGTLNMEAAANTIGTPSAPINTLALNAATLTFYENGSSLNAAALSLTVANTNVVNIGSLPIISSLPTAIPLITYAPGQFSSLDGNPSNLVLGAISPNTYSGYITNDGVSTITLVITSGPIFSKADQWGGNANNNWDTTSLNWTNLGVSVKYAEGDFAAFDDKGDTNIVNLTGVHTPAKVSVTNSVLNYVFSGTGAISGASSLSKYGSASLTLAESGGDNFAGGIFVHGGTLVLDDPNSNLSGGLTNDAGTVVQIGNGDGNGVLPGGGLDDEGTFVFNRSNNLTVAVIIPGGGALTQNGSGRLTLNNANTYTGNTTINGGTLALGAAGSVASTTVSAQNGTLDLTAYAGAALNVVTLKTNAILNIGTGANNPQISSFSLSNSTITLTADYNNIGGNAVLSASSLTTGGTTNIINVTAISHLPITATVPFTIPLIKYGSASYPGGFNIGWTNLPGIAGYITDDPGNQSVDLVVTVAPQSLTWNGGSTTGNYWSDANNWTGTALAPLDAMIFDGTTRLNTTNDTAAGTTYAGASFNPGAGAFTLNGNPVNLTGTSVNNSPNIQTINLGLIVKNAFTLDGGTGGGAFVINGGVTNASASAQTVTLLDNGTINDLWSSTPTNQIEFQTDTAGGEWMILDGTGSSSQVSAGIQLNVANGTLDFGTTNSSPNLDTGTNGSVTITGPAAGQAGTFNMNNGTLKVRSMTLASAGTTLALFNMNGGTLILGPGAFTAGSGNGASTLTVTITNGAIYSTNGGNFQLADRSLGTYNQSGGLVQCGTLVPATGQTAGGNGIYNLSGGTLICNGMTVGSSGANAWGTINYNGGTIKPGANSAAFFTRNNSAILTNSVQAGGIIVDTAGFSTVFNLPLVSDPTTDPNQGGTAPDGGLTKLGQGTLTLSAANTYNGNTSVGGGTLLVNGSVLNTAAVTVSNNATLGGSGTIGTNVTVNAGGTLSPGNNAVGTLTINGNVTLAGTNLMEVDKVAGTNDLLIATSTNAPATTITYGGTLKVATLAGSIVASDAFKLFSATNYAGAFAAITPATPGAGLGWNTNTLTTDGTLRVVTTVNLTPTNITASVSGNMLTLKWPADHTGWRLLVQTNPLSSGLNPATNAWFTVAGSTLVNSNVVTINPANGTVFYRMVYP